MFFILLSIMVNKMVNTKQGKSRFVWTSENPRQAIRADVREARRSPVDTEQGEEEQMEDKPKLKLVGEDGNAYNLLGLAHRAAKEAGWPQDRWEKVRDKAISGNYDHLLFVLQEEFDVY